MRLPLGGPEETGQPDVRSGARPERTPQYPASPPGCPWGRGKGAGNRPGERAHMGGDATAANGSASWGDGWGRSQALSRPECLKFYGNGLWFVGTAAGSFAAPSLVRRRIGRTDNTTVSRLRSQTFIRPTDHVSELQTDPSRRTIKRHQTRSERGALRPTAHQRQNNIARNDGTPREDGAYTAYTAAGLRHQGGGVLSE
ncbi:hypothetical protein SKAU_G00205380 [Synaphobranchus kaupii]|uniref:Uncharacterized protein n=1 Tax=Synaphobranchus kaupii TaxID=118154 RepID=A0A9Q1IXQ2_SYNKA|nr:hypothetical protein SKAU_G00205380 [Synaphobranchus kaupii]